ncbi:MAG: AAA family ATPase [Alphaproteobacteria bacterium]|nr:AAA family ATPase [Alphaproteobacteria bacterium]
MIIHLNGMTGVGKLTVGKLLAGKLGARLIDNHSVLDLVTAVHVRRTPLYFVMIDKIMDVVFNEISTLPKEQIFIFTNCLSTTHAEDMARQDAIANFAAVDNRPFIQVMLTCTLEENKKRVISADRTSKRKLLDPVILEDLCQRLTMYHPLAEHMLTIDTTDKIPETTAEEIASFALNIK